ncbi:MAG TPA: DUF3160 domain-containing protein [Candidatus Hypogeohydataceae bacterium YC40]
MNLKTEGVKFLKVTSRPFTIKAGDQFYFSCFGNSFISPIHEFDHNPWNKDLIDGFCSHNGSYSLHRAHRRYSGGLKIVILNRRSDKISEQELTNRDLEKADYDFIKGIGSTLEDLVTFSAEEKDKITSEADTKMEIAADVHTDGNTMQVLEEGVGKPINLLVVVADGGDLFLTSGAVLSYYEFKQPMSDRLTDEEWQQMTKPPLPKFTKSFIGE